jgi:hypothetical protein
MRHWRLRRERNIGGMSRQRERERMVLPAKRFEYSRKD